MKKAIVLAMLMGAVIPAFARDNSASAWEFRNKTCSFIGEIAASGRMAALKGEPEPVWPDSLAKNNAFYAFEIYSLAMGYRSQDTVENTGRWAMAKCYDNVDDIQYLWQRGQISQPNTWR